MLLTPQIVTNLTLDTIFIALGTIAMYVSIEILLQYKPNSYTIKQFQLQKKGYLSSTIAYYILLFKIPLFLFFIYTLDTIAPLLKGAMCGVGVIEASSYGIYLIILKILSLYFFGFWLLLHKIDIADKYQRLLKIKSLYFLIIFVIFCFEVILEYLYFLDIKPNSLVDCCGVVFSPNKTTLLSHIIALPNKYLYGSFYSIFIFFTFSYMIKNKLLLGINGILFFVIALISLIGYFGTYIYELPTHHCPFCLLQKDYHYIGYILYSCLFLGTFYAIATPLLHLPRKFEHLAFFFTSCYVIIISFYPLFYYYTNKTWLY